VWQFGNAGFGNSECRIFDIFTKVFCRQCNCWNLALPDLGILAK
jgi:hypothetical protein